MDSDLRDLVRRRLDFVHDRRTAEAVVKAVLTPLVAQLREEDRLRVLEQLPDGFAEQVERDARPDPLADLDRRLAERLTINQRQAQQAIRVVINELKACLPPDMVDRMRGHLPAEWRQLVEAA